MNDVTVEVVNDPPTEPKRSGCNQYVAGLAIMSTDYNFFIINMVLVLLKEVNGV